MRTIVNTKLRNARRCTNKWVLPLVCVEVPILFEVLTKHFKLCVEVNERETIVAVYVDGATHIQDEGVPAVRITTVSKCNLRSDC